MIQFIIIIQPQIFVKQKIGKAVPPAQKGKNPVVFAAEEIEQRSQGSGKFTLPADDGFCRKLHAARGNQARQHDEFFQVGSNRGGIKTPEGKFSQSSPDRIVNGSSKSYAKTVQAAGLDCLNCFSFYSA
ncbi:MAG: hypothetical protein HFJ85_00430 [Oscillospiraceae bacterium]|nr:hypothetical protein [Oscillospiraceae bacterium]